MKEKLFVNAVVTLVDAKHILLHLDDSAEAREQIAFADVILLNKCDLVGASDLDALELRIRSMNALARIHRTTNAGIEIPKVLDVGGFNLDHAMEVDPHFLEGHHHHHNDDVSSVGIEADGDCDGKKLNDWLSKVIREQGADIFRMKGVFALGGQPDRIIFQGVHMIMDAANGGPWGERPRHNRLVFIGRHLDRAALNAGFRNCLV
jgi:G3E family GTPase